MPSNEKEIKVKITAKDQASKELETAMDKVKTSAKVAFAAVAGAVALSVNAAAEFERGMSNVYTLVDRNKEAFHDMENDIKAMAATTPVAIGDLTSALYDVRSAGVGAGDAMGVLEKSAKLGVAGLGTTKEAVNLATSAINAFQLKGKESDAAFNTMFLTVKAGKTTIAELAQSFGMVAPVAATAGIKFEEVQAATAALTVTGQKASVAQTQLRAAILALQAPSDSMQKLLEKAKITDVGATLAKEGLVKTMQRVSDAAQGNITDLKGAYGSVEALGASLSLTGAQAETFSSTLEQMQTAANGTESATKDLEAAFQLQKATFSAQSQILKNQLNTVLIDLGSVIMPILIEKMESLGRVLTNVTNWWMGLDQGTKEFIGTIVGAVASFVTTAAVLVGIATAVAKVSEAMKVLNLVLKANPILFIVGLLISLGVALYNLYQNNEEFRKKVDEVWGKVSETVTTVVNAVVEAFNWCKEQILDFWNKIKEYAKAGSDALNAAFKWFNDNIVPIFTNAWKWIVDKVTAAYETIKRGMQAFNEFMQPIWDALWRFYQKVIEPILSFISNLISATWEGIKAGLTSFIAIVSPIWEAFWGVIKAVASAVWEFIKAGIKLLWDHLTGSFTAVAQVVGPIWSRLWDGIKSVVSTVWEGIKKVVSGGWEAIQKVFNTISDILGKIWTGIWDGITKTVTDARDTIVKIIDGITNAITAIPKAIGSAVTAVGNAASNAGSWVSNKASGAVSSVKSFFGYADGGRMSAGETRLVGENGPERFMPDVSGMIIPNDQLGGQQITMVFSNNQFLDSTGAEKIMELAFQKFKLINKI